MINPIMEPINPPIKGRATPKRPESYALVPFEQWEMPNTNPTIRPILPPHELKKMPIIIPITPPIPKLSPLLELLP